jgi:outer membrane protein TolC
VNRTQAALARQEAAYRLARMRYEGGLSDYLTVLIIEDALLAAREQEASLRLRGFVLDVALTKALGGGFRASAPDERATHISGMSQ